MSFTETHQMDPSDQESQEQDPNIRLLREKAKRADEVDALNKAQAREIAVLRSGIDVDSPLGAYFVQSYDGDPSDIDTLKAKATELGVPFKGTQVVEETPVEPVETPTEPTGTDERKALADGAAPDSKEEDDPRKVAKDTYDRMMAAGAPQDEAAGEHFAVLARAAQAGDKRVIVE